MNHRKDLANIYESTIINEIAGAINYWLLPSGELIKVHDHIYYAVENFPELEKEFYMQEDFPYNNDGSIVDEEDVYFAAGEHGYTRVVEESANIYFTYLMSVKPNKSQFTTLFNLANDKDKNLIDGETQKVIVKNNEISSDSIGDNAQVKQMDQDLQPSFYRNKGRYGESNENRFSLKDYTKLIVE